jgi:branched-chain amino acid transport system ATP-binding protein
MAEPLLLVDNLVKHFGGLIATDHLTLEVHDSEIHALIGPNGAGKSTLIAQITGEQRSDSGDIRFAGQRLNGLRPAARARLGLGRTFQIVQLLPAMTALDNIAMALRAHRRESFSIWREARRDAATENDALAGLARLEIAHCAQTPVASLAHGEQKQLELAIALAMQPRLLLLDEPLAGLGAAESVRMIDILQSLKGQIAMLLVEHDMEAVYALADRISVLTGGRLLASGSAKDIQSNAQVRAAYLGEDEVDLDALTC